jgi:hypothetical protein
MLKVCGRSLQARYATKMHRSSIWLMMLGVWGWWRLVGSVGSSRVTSSHIVVGYCTYNVLSYPNCTVAWCSCWPSWDCLKEMYRNRLPSEGVLKELRVPWTKGPNSMKQ